MPLVAWAHPPATTSTTKMTLDTRHLVVLIGAATTAGPPAGAGQCGIHPATAQRRYCQSDGGTITLYPSDPLIPSNP